MNIDRARLIRNVIRTKSEDIGWVGIGVVCRDTVFIAAPPFFDGSRGFHRPGTLAHSNLDCGNEKKHVDAWLLQTSWLVGHVVAVTAAARHARAAARRWRTDRGMWGPTRGSGSIHRLVSIRSTHEVPPTSRFVSIVEPASRRCRGRRFVSPSRRSWGCSTRRGTRERRVGRGLIRTAV